MVTKEEFNKVWKDSTKEDILNQFYYEHIAIRKAIEYLDKVETLATLDGKIIFSINIFRNILQNGSDSQ